MNIGTNIFLKNVQNLEHCINSIQINQENDYVDRLTLSDLKIAFYILRTKHTTNIHAYTMNTNSTSDGNLS